MVNSPKSYYVFGQLDFTWIPANAHPPFPPLELCCPFTEVLDLVRDMDNEVSVETLDAEMFAAPYSKSKAELKLCDTEWDHHPRLALAQPDRLMRLANTSSSTSR